MSEEQQQWDSIPEHGEEQKPESSEPVAKSQPDPEPEPQEEKEIPWEKRYKDMESEFGRRGTKISDLEREVDKNRMDRLEMQQKLQSLEALKEEIESYKEAKKAPEPIETEDFFSADDKQAMEDFPELAQLSKKIIQQELHKSNKERLKSEEAYKKEIESLKEELGSYGRTAKQTALDKFLSSNVSPMNSQIDSDPDFHAYVNASKTRYNMMTSGDVNDMAEVMKDFIQTDSGKKYSDNPPDEEAAPNIEKRQAAQGLVGKSSLPSDRNPREMTAEELWEETPEYEN